MALSGIDHYRKSHPTVFPGFDVPAQGIYMRKRPGLGANPLGPANILEAMFQ
jgi:hypothetical protein